MRVPSSVLQQAMDFCPDDNEEGCGDSVDAREHFVSWLKMAFGIDAVANKFEGKPWWPGELGRSNS